MSYFGFLLQYLGIPIAILSILTIIDFARGKWMPKALFAFQPWKVLFGLCIVAFLYTTPWDNYLVATNVWWYDPSMVTGIVFGYVPIEEYTFFIVQPIMTGLLFILLARYLPVNPIQANNPRLRWLATGITAIVWLIFLGLFILSFFNDSFAPYTYMAITLSWALIPVMIQLAFGADILARHWLAVLLGILIPSLYLSWADSLAIFSGTWTINPEQSIHVLIGGVLPFEEALFFFITNTLVVLGMTLVLAEESLPRAMQLERFAILRPALHRLRGASLSNDIQTLRT